MKKEPKTIKIKIKKDKIKTMKKLTPIPEQKPIAPVKKIKMKQSLQMAVLAKFNKMKNKKKEKVEEKKSNFQDTDTRGLEYDKTNKLFKWKNNIYKPFSVQQFARMVQSYNSHEDGVNDPKMFGMGKKLVKQSKLAMVKIQNNLNSERV